MLESEGPLIGAVEGLEFDADEIIVPVGSRLFVYSDGAFEIIRSDGTMWPFQEFVAVLSGGLATAGSEQPSPEAGMDALLARIRDISDREDFQDDFSMLGLVLE
jgi:sigma-B regulation protein RsbU (phosphoserine phosphatase)